MALQGKDLKINGEGTQRRNVLYVDDCVDAILPVAANDTGLEQTLFARATRNTRQREFAVRPERYLK